MKNNGNKKIFLLTLVLYLISFSIQEKHQGSDSVLEIEYDDKKAFTEFEVENSKQNQKLMLKYDKTASFQFYMKIELTVTGNYPTPLLCFSATDLNCDDREQIVKNPNDKSVVMWLKREQFFSEDLNLYIKVMCEKDGAGYILRFEGYQAIQFGPNFIYSYYIGANNKEVHFEIKGNGNTGTLVAAVQGSKNPSISMEGGEPRSYEKVKIAYFPVTKETNNTLTVLTIKASNEDYLTVSVHLITRDGFSEILEPNGPEVIGYLTNGIIKEDCYKISHFSTIYKNANTYYLTGSVNTMFAFLYLKDKNGNKIGESFQVINNGLISTVINSIPDISQICIALQDNEDQKFKNNLYYTLTLTEPKTLNSLYDYYPPQLPGHIYRRFLPKGKIAFYSPMSLDNTIKKYNYNLYSIKGYSKMGIDKCTDYPNCNHENLNGLIIPKNSNQMTIWTTEEDISSSIGKVKNVIVVECADDDNEGNGYCLFEISFLNKADTINLIPNEKFSHYVLKEEKGTFKLNIGEGIDGVRLIVDIMIFSGDVSFNVKPSETQQLNYHKYYLSNKVFFYFDLSQSSSEYFEIAFAASLNSFFTIQYSFYLDEPRQEEEIVPAGENYLVQIDPTSFGRKKTVHLQNLRYKKEKPFLANFFALNCDFEVKRNGAKIDFFDGYAQEVLTLSDDEYKKENYDYEISITEPDLSNYNHKMCMLYVGGIESDEDYQKEIIIGENINQQIIFENGFNKVRFLYPQADADKDISIYVNVIDQAIYQMTIFLNNEKEPIQTNKITRTQIFYISRSSLQDICSNNQLCSVIVQIEYIGELIKTNPMIEVTVRYIKNIPSYIQKGRAKRDFTCGDNFYYLYTDIGKNEEGEVLVDFLRDFGDVWGKIVRKDQTSIDEEANWRGIYRMPSKDWEDSLEYNQYIKKIIVRTEDTSDCIEGCYLLLSIRISQIGDYVDDSKFYPFSILPKISPNNRAYTDIPKVVLQVDEYIIGNVDISNNERISQFYEVWLPHDSPRVDFDWQSGVAGLYINIGGIRPTTKNSHFILNPPGRDSIISLTKEEIIKKAGEKGITLPNKNSIQDLNLVIGVWTDKTSAAETEIYSLRIHEISEDNDKLDIIEVKSDKKIICKPHHLTENNYRCLFMVTYDNDDSVSATPFFGHASSVDLSSMTYMYASFVERDLYDELNNDGLKKVLPTEETSVYNSKTDGVDYIYVPKLDVTKYLFINVITESSEDIIFIPSMPLCNFISYDMFEYYPTPGKEQLLAVPLNKLRLQFATEKSILVNIVTLYGEAEVSWKNDPNTVFILRGRGDRLTLSSGNEADQLIIQKKIYDKEDEDENPDKKKNLKEKMENPGFLFYISYYIKEVQNFDEVIYGKSLEFAYKDSDLPVTLYSKLGNITSDLNVAVTFKDLQLDNSGHYNFAPLSVRASLLKENAIYKAKKDPELAPSIDRLIVGTYDTAIKTAQVMISKETINKFNFRPIDKPTLYLSIDKNKNVNPKIYEKFSVEVQFSKANEGVIPTEKVYHYGQLGDQSRRTYYKLRIDRQKTFMRIILAFNSNYISYYITDILNNQRKNVTFIDAIKERGKIMVTLSTKGLTREYLYLVLYRNEQKNLYLYNYVFKYMNARSIDNYVDYKIKESEEIICNEDINEKEPSESSIECAFYKIDIDKSKANITYFLKIVDAKSYLAGEISDTIAVMESRFYTVYQRNPTDNNNVIILKAKGDFSKWTILQIVAQIQEETILEYVAYKGQFVQRKKDDDEEDEEKVDTTMFFVVGGILLFLIIGLIVLIFIFKIKNQELIEQVKHVSFQKTNSMSINNSNTKENLLQK